MLKLACILVLGLLISVAACAPRSTSALPGLSAPPDTSTPPKGTLSGMVLAGPTCPVEQAEQPCPPRPVPDRVVLIETPEGAIVTQVTTDKSGHFQVTLPPGTYLVQVQQGQGLFPRQHSPQRVTIVAGQTAQVTIELDSGIR